MNVFFYICNIVDATWKKTINDTASTIVVINGLAITAGSNFNFFAIKGRVHPIILAIIIVQSNVMHTTVVILNGIPSINSNLVL